MGFGFELELRRRASLPAANNQVGPRDRLEMRRLHVVVVELVYGGTKVIMFTSSKQTMLRPRLKFHPKTVRRLKSC